MTETHSEKRLIGYARVSTYGQTLDSQLRLVKELRLAGAAEGPKFADSPLAPDS